MAIKTLGVVGAGQMGRGIAQIALASGNSVTLSDTNEETLKTAVQALRSGIETMVSKKLCSHSLLNDLPITTSTDLSLHHEADVVIEAAPEDALIKREIFATLDDITPERTTLCSNTSSLSLTTIASWVRHPARVVGMHFFNPVHRMKLVEVIPALQSAPYHVQRIEQLARAFGKTPCVVKDSPGFTANRILLPMINEAIYCLHEGLAKAEDIDTVVRLGMAHPMGPLQLADVIGLDTCLSILRILHQDLGDQKYRPCPLLSQLVAAGYLGKKSGRGFYTYPR